MKMCTTSSDLNEETPFKEWLTSVFREVICNGVDHFNCLPCQQVFTYTWDNFKKVLSHRNITRAVKSSFPNSRKLQLADKDCTRIFCGIGFHISRKDEVTSFQFDHLWNKSRDLDTKDKLKREMQQLVFYNPGPSTKDLLGFKPEFSNREKRKLNRLLDDKTGRPKRNSKPRKPPLYDEKGCLISTAEDLCDCMVVDCPGCHYPCPQCNSEKCGSTCRCNRKWKYDFVTMNTGK